MNIIKKKLAYWIREYKQWRFRTGDWLYPLWSPQRWYNYYFGSGFAEDVKLLGFKYKKNNTDSRLFKLRCAVEIFVHHHTAHIKEIRKSWDDRWGRDW